MKILRTAVFSLALLTTFAAPAYADGSASISRLTLKAGAFTFADSNTQTQSAFAAGFDYILGRPLPLTPTLVSIYGDALSNSTGIGVAMRNSGPFYIGFGLGFYHVSVTPNVGCPASPGFVMHSANIYCQRRGR